MEKILIIGSMGQLAFDLKKVLKGDYEIISATRKDFDVSDWLKTREFIVNCRPDIVINTAAYHKTEECEINPEKSFAANALGAFNAAKAAKEIGAKIIFFSTDYVFDGSKKFFIESDVPNPLNVYGASKLAGENLIKIANDNFYTIRTSWLFGIHKSSKGLNFVNSMLEKAKNNEIIKVVNDQFGCPTYTYDLAVKIKELIDKNVPAGTYHITNSGSCSWHEFAKKIFELVNLKPNLEEIESGAGLSKIRRPQYSVLISENLKKQGIENLRPWQEALSAYLDEINKEALKC